MLKRLIVFILILAGLAGGLKLAISIYLSKKIEITTPVRLKIPRGESLTRLAYRLSQKNLIQYPKVFVKVGQLYGYDQSIKYGEYEVQPMETYHDLIKKIVNGDTFKYLLTFVEGEHIFDYSRKLAESGLCSPEEFLAAVQDPNLIRELLGEKLNSLEGYLFPETYAFSKVDGVKKIVQTMVDKFLEETQDLNFKQNGLDRHQLVTLASIVEKETGAEFERPVISSVFHNRLKKGMRLQTDPTIIYGVMKESGREILNIRKKDITKPTPYNTYVIKGLPPGPIGNPGIEALRAAVNPQSTPYLFFVSQNDGTHIFTETYKEHLKAVRKYQMDPKMRQGKSWRDLKQKRTQ